MSRFRTVRVSDPRNSPEHVRFACFKSPSLGGRADVTLFVPPGAGADTPRAILLHGVYSSHWAWAFTGGVPATARGMIGRGEIRPMAIAMPSDGLRGDGSCYVDAFERYIVEEVPELIAEVTGCGGPLMIGGLSMGGYGALRLGARHPDRFRAISAHSAITSLEQLRDFIEEPLPQVEGPSALEWLVRNRASLSPLRFDCGTEDPLIGPNRTLHRELEAQGVPHVYEEHPGEHNWDYWSVHVAATLRHFSANA